MFMIEFIANNVWYVLLLFLLLILLKYTVVVVGGSEMAIIERQFFGKKMKMGQIIAKKDEIGVRAKTLGPGLHFLIPFLYKTKKCGFLTVEENEVALLESIDGEPLPTDKIFAQIVSEHNSFQDAEAFLNNGGQRGPQIQYLTPGNYRINPMLFKITKIKSISIPMGHIGIVTATDGMPIEYGKLLGKSIEGHKSFQDGEAFLKSGGQKGPQIDVILPGTYRINTELFNVQICKTVFVPAEKIGVVTALDGKELPKTEYVAVKVENHNNFQNGEAFLRNGGQRGPQWEVLRPGTYYINPFLFSVEINNVAKIERGEVAVIVSNVGNQPDETVTKGGDGKESYVVPQGTRGIQRDVVGPGVYYLNPLAFIPYIINTTNITIDWNDDANTKFNSLKVVSKDGFEISVSVKVIIRIQPEQAPFMVAKIGSIDNLISNVIHPMIDSSFRNQASATQAMAFMQNRVIEQDKAEAHTRSELAKYNVECVSVLICQIELPQDLMQTQTARIIAEQQKEMFKEQQLAEQTRIATEKSRAEANQQKNLMEAEIGVKIAEQKKLAAIKQAEGERETKRLIAEGEAKGIAAIGDAEAGKIKAIGNATAEAYRMQCEAISSDNVTSIEIFKRIAEGKIKITPEILVQGQGAGNDGSGSLVTAFLGSMLSKENKEREKSVVRRQENKENEVNVKVESKPLSSEGGTKILNI